MLLLELPRALKKRQNEAFSESETDTWLLGFDVTNPEEGIGVHCDITKGWFPQLWLVTHLQCGAVGELTDGLTDVMETNIVFQTLEV